MQNATIIKTLSELKEHASRLQAELDDCSMMDGTPFITYLQPYPGHPGGDTIYIWGYTYEDQAGYEKGKSSFRYQRRFDLCGCSCTDKQGAVIRCRRANLDPAISKVGVVSYMHSREWKRQQVASLKLTIEHLEAYLATQPAEGTAASDDLTK